MLKNNKILFRIFLLCVFGAVFVASAVQPQSSEEKTENLGMAKADAVFTPHKALYEIQLAGTKSGAQIVNIRGQMLYEWENTCDAWNANHRFNLVYEYSDSPALQVTSDFSTFETYDGKSFDFNSLRKRNGDVFEELRGQATFETSGGKGQALYTKPNGLTFDLPAEALFPMAHTIEVLRHMKAGKKFYNATIFDGSDEKGPVEVNTFIGKEANALASIDPSAALDMALLNTPAKTVQLAFFPLSEPSSTADYEMTLVLHENGVVSDMFIEYDDFSVKQNLVALEKVESQCEDK